MQAIEFETNLTGKTALELPKKVAKQLPSSGKAKVIVLYGDDNNADWQKAAYEQFMKDDAAEDAVYDKFAKGR
ncbi:MAG TPA: hypothetical protein VGG19_04640 [Tepidisphaeraceae bacterium]|jgi:hypothetical protein